MKVGRIVLLGLAVAAAGGPIAIAWLSEPEPRAVTLDGRERHVAPSAGFAVSAPVDANASSPRPDPATHDLPRIDPATELHSEGRAMTFAQLEAEHTPWLCEQLHALGRVAHDGSITTGPPDDGGPPATLRLLYSARPCEQWNAAREAAYLSPFGSARWPKE
ncbi:MAG TPA: hypothetical protein VN680_01465 [Burkholderiaceae bacterium]|jgi:hypothetical protein|nr:hypothetical protein [Burkholderiaceae bacterium]